MNITRTCANCAAFNSDHNIGNDEPECWNLTSVIEHPGTAQALHRAPGPTDYCDCHQTPQEDAEQTAYIEANRDEIMAAIRQHAASEQVMQRVIVKMRKGPAP